MHLMRGMLNHPTVFRNGKHKTCSLILTHKDTHNYDLRVVVTDNGAIKCENFINSDKRYSWCMIGAIDTLIFMSGCNLNPFHNVASLIPLLFISSLMPWLQCQRRRDVQYIVL